MTGLRRNDIGFNIGSFPGRKKPYLYVETGNQAFAVGQFKDERRAELFMKVLDYVCFGNGESVELSEEIGGREQ